MATCKNCGKSNLKWHKTTSGKWQLMEDCGRLERVPHAEWCKKDQASNAELQAHRAARMAEKADMAEAVAEARAFLESQGR